MLSGKNVLLGITGSIAAYKTAFLIRLLKKTGANVQPVMTNSAKDFISPLTLSTLSGNPVLSEYSNIKSGEWNSHVKLGLWADVFLIAPATANTMAKMANGICDNLLLATYLSARCPIVLAPAMDLDMYKHPATLKNIELLRSYGNHILDVEYGELASGLVGDGRMMEPEDIIAQLPSFLSSEKKKTQLSGKRVLISAGPTYEAIDPVRFIGNHSSGKMGFELAKEAQKQGAEVVLVSGPTHLTLNSGIKRIDVRSAQDMYDVCITQFDRCDIAIMAAAVADYTPLEVADQKIKKKEDDYSIALKPTKDILKELGQRKRNDQLLVGFALETENEIENAKKKIQNKNLDFIVLNSLNDNKAGFGYDTNKVTIIDKDNKKEQFELKSKASVAEDIMAKIAFFLK